MTGFARVSRACAGGDLILSIKGVNHRGLDLHFHLPPEFDTIEPAIRARIKPRVGRGHLLVVINYSRAGVDGHAVPVLNRPLFDSWLAAFREASTTSGSDALPDIASALRLPGMLHASTTGQALTGEAETAVMTALDEALQAFNAEREREGAALCAELESRSRTVQDLAARIEAIRAGATAALGSDEGRQLTRAEGEALVAAERAGGLPEGGERGLEVRPHGAAGDRARRHHQRRRRVLDRPWRSPAVPLRRYPEGLADEPAGVAQLGDELLLAREVEGGQLVAGEPHVAVRHHPHALPGEVAVVQTVGVERLQAFEDAKADRRCLLR